MGEKSFQGLLTAIKQKQKMAGNLKIGYLTIKKCSGWMDEWVEGGKSRFKNYFKYKKKCKCGCT